MSPGNDCQCVGVDNRAVIHPTRGRTQRASGSDQSDLATGSGDRAEREVIGGTEHHCGRIRAKECIRSSGNGTLRGAEGNGSSAVGGNRDASG